MQKGSKHHQGMSSQKQIGKINKSVKVVKFNHHSLATDIPFKNHDSKGYQQMGKNGNLGGG